MRVNTGRCLLPLLWFIQIISAVQDFPALDHIRTRTSASTQTHASQALIGRIVGKRANEFTAHVQPDLGPKDRDTFKIWSSGSYVNITGTTGVAVAMGLYYYLTNHCGCQYTWAGQQMNIPSPLPKVPAPGIKVTTNDRFRYYQNVCTVDYSFVWYNWTDWQQQLDWMALHGINMPLAFTGQEAIFQQVYMEMGLTMKEVQDHFAGPAFLAWSRMGNMHGWGGPLPQSWINQQLVLQHKILDRARELGMIPVLPGFAGHVPSAITRIFPNANVSHLPDWGHFNSSFCCNLLLDFSDPLFKRIGHEVVKEMLNEFGTDHVYNIDTFNEMLPKSSSPTYLAQSAKTVFEALTSADQQAVWLMQGWIFENSVDFWKSPQIKAVVTAVPKGRMIILELFAENRPVYRHTESYFGQPFIWSMLHNFGGTLELYGSFDSINTGPAAGRNFPNSTMIGIGMAPEGINQNEVIYEFMAENAWVPQPRGVSQWVVEYARRRYGKSNKYSSNAWQLLRKSVYNNTDGLKDKSKHVIPTSRPSYHPRLAPDVWYDPEDLYEAWDNLVLAADQLCNNSLSMYDLVDVTRNSLQEISLSFYNSLISAFTHKDFDQVSLIGDKLLGLLADMDIYSWGQKVTSC
ncbi:alpha-N-acetylglucosaminidase-like isoform X1 [Mizuhopecten yessoensis]|uniref:alpha-N-acetylglucosaminidase-like isoform X1 n=1 Tax=Mizuhopecten yessoensis TaxID=6573 RepID=UPI000B45D844|nr:alpha-N-acetylglucosaminidase-like isoform X1 [Mizuhopecten yessoensis]XP_021363589.1 alpha-N-acetylglucosaminidase-like isoform X1 [Mizuhopecten yessoensis]XP_021363598.1 alpha-N-acetylglucosaminidase-like isoform X1 [Mizuhopecten yessoensis]